MSFEFPFECTYFYIFVPSDITNFELFTTFDVLYTLAKCFHVKIFTLFTRHEKFLKFLHVQVNIKKFTFHGWVIMVESRIKKNLNQVSREIKTITLHEKAIGDSQKIMRRNPWEKPAYGNGFFKGRESSNRVLPRPPPPKPSC